MAGFNRYGAQISFSPSQCENIVFHQCVDSNCIYQELPIRIISAPFRLWWHISNIMINFDDYLDDNINLTISEVSIIMRLLQIITVYTDILSMQPNQYSLTV